MTLFRRLRRPAPRRALPLTLAAAAALSAAPHAARAQVRYLAVGDSYAFGYSTPSATPFNGGLNGYVSYVAKNLFGATDATLASVAVSTARPGETITQQTGATFFTTSPNAQYGVANYNTNYGPNFTANQQTLLGGLLSNAGFASGIQLVTVQLGGNDVLGPILSPTFRALNEIQRQAVIDTAFTQLQTNLTSIVGGLRSSLPNARILLVGYADPFAALDTSASPYGAVFPTTYPEPYTNAVVLRANNQFAALAASITGVKFVNTYSTINASSATINQFTRINDLASREGGEPNYHLTDAGYNQVGALIVAAAAAPEPGSLVLLLPGIGGMAWTITRRQRKISRSRRG